MKTKTMTLLLAALTCGTLAANSSDAALSGQLGVLDVSGINPATGVQWAAGDEYRLTFVSSTRTTASSADITTYNTFIQNTANAAGLGGVTWYAVGSTSTVDAIDNTNTNSSDGDGVGEAIILMDGTTIIAEDYDDLWDGILVTPFDVLKGNPLAIETQARGIYFNENGVNIGPANGSDDRIFTGTNGDGTKSTTQHLGTVLDTKASTGSTGSGFPIQFWSVDGDGESTRWTADFSAGKDELQEMYGISETLVVVPEPSSLALLGLGGLMIARRRRG
ncbi:MAG: PEP-CTERM sorting domain-containing protein [Phycisphaeraceae bacterium]